MASKSVKRKYGDIKLKEFGDIIYEGSEKGKNSVELQRAAEFLASYNKAYMEVYKKDKPRIKEDAMQHVTGAIIPLYFAYMVLIKSYESNGETQTKCEKHLAMVLNWNDRSYFDRFTILSGLCDALDTLKQKKIVKYENVSLSDVSEQLNMILTELAKEGTKIKSNKLEPYLKANEIFFKAGGEINMPVIPEKHEKMIEDYIQNGVCQIILTGAPGTGKTRMAKEIATGMGGSLDWETEKPKYKFVQFHPSYDYTDFVEGLRPIEKDKVVTFKKVDGIFKKFCRKIVEENNNSADKKKKYFFIIDEINRADLSKVFGELMYCLEQDKRGSENRIQTQYQNLPTYDVDKKEELSEKDDVFKDGFYIPEEIVIIGTMNDIDRSVESMDMALRRRFVWMEVKVNPDLLTTALSAILSERGIKDVTVTEKIVECIEKVNAVIGGEREGNNNYTGKRYGLNHHYDISQGQFTGLPVSTYDKLNTENGINEFMEDVWNMRLRSLIYEYVRGEDDADDFVKKCEAAFLSSITDAKSTPQEVAASDGQKEKADGVHEDTGNGN